jgi:hypothetical protein
VSVATDLGAWSKPWWTQDFEDWLTVIGEMFAPVEVLAADREDGTAGWSVMLDVDVAPSGGLPYLAQWVGERLPQGISEVAARQWIRDAPNQVRGTAEGIARAGQRHLTGTRTIMMHERYKIGGAADPDYLTVLTLESETASETTTRADLLSCMPADIQLDYDAVSGVIWATVESVGTWADVEAEGTWADVGVSGPSTAGGWRVWTALS